jgi:hypothetical protein
MKNIILLMLSCFAFSMNVGAQSKYIVSQPVALLSAAVKSGNYSFVIPKNISKADVAESAEYYTMYFDVNFDEDAHRVEIKMKINDERSKHVIVRFFVSLDLKEVDMNGQIIPIEKYYQTYIKS